MYVITEMNRINFCLFDRERLCQEAITGPGMQQYSPGFIEERSKIW